MRELILLALVVISIPFVWKKPIYGLAIYLGFNVVRPEMFFWGGHGGSYVFKLYYGLLLLIYVSQGYLAKTGKIFCKDFILMLWLLAAIYLSMIFSNYYIGDREYTYFVEMIKTFGICALLLIYVEDFEDVKKITNVLLWCFVFLGVWGIDQSFRGNARLEGLGGSAWGDSNGVAAMYVLFLPLALTRFFTCKKGKEYLLSCLFVVIMLLLIVLTKSRGGLLGTIACLGTFGFFTHKVRKTVMIVVLLSVLILPFVSDSYLSRMKTLESSETLGASANSRFVLWEAGLMVFRDNPIFGTGFLTYPRAKMVYEDHFMYLEDSFRRWVFRHRAKKVSHSAYIQILSDCGLVGAIPYFLLIVGAAFNGLKARRLLKYNTDKREELIWLCGASAGLCGFAVSILTIDAVLMFFLYIQIIMSAIVMRNLSSPNILSQGMVATGANKCG